METDTELQKRSGFFQPELPEELVHQIRNDTPWTHYVFDDFLSQEYLRKFAVAAENVSEFRTLADDPLEVKFAPLNDLDLAETFLSLPFVRLLRDMTGHWCYPSDGLIQVRVSDASTPAFPVHVDEVGRPSFVMLYYISPNWCQEDGGRLRLHQKSDGPCLKEIDPLPNRLVIFETSDHHWHSVEKVRSGLRHSILVEWLY